MTGMAAAGSAAAAAAARAAVKRFGTNDMITVVPLGTVGTVVLEYLQYDASRYVRVKACSDIARPRVDFEQSWKIVF